MFQNVVEREMVFAKAGVRDEQKPILNRFIQWQTKKAFIVGILIGGAAALSAFLIGWSIMLNMIASTIV